MKIGLEVHVQLNTDTKLFCGCSNKHADEPNTNTCPTCIGLPGSKPRLNRKAIEFATKIALAFNCKFSKEMFFSRKVYFYPDLAKDFQITQYEIPLCTGGHVMVDKNKILLTRVHMEEDPGRLVHVGSSMQTAKYVLVDYNRSGTPLCEIVTEPVFTTPKEARAFLEHISNMLEYMKVFDSSKDGSMRVDANISMHSNRVEIKNITSFKDVEKALTFESIRQKNLHKRNQEVKRETRGWDAAAGITRSQRSKEEEDDYGYIVDTDLPSITLKKSEIDRLRKELPEFADEKIKRYVKQFKIPEKMAESIASSFEAAEMFEEVSKKADERIAADWFAGIIKKTLNYNSLKLSQSKLTSDNVVKLIDMVAKKKITKRTAEHVIRDMVLKDVDLSSLGETSARISTETDLDGLVKEVLDENAQAIIDFKKGRKESFNFLVGQVMRKTRGRGDPEAIRKLLQKKLK